MNRAKARKHWFFSKPAPRLLAQDAIWSAVTKAALRAGRGTAFRPVLAKAASRVPHSGTLAARTPDPFARLAEYRYRNQLLFLGLLPLLVCKALKAQSSIRRIERRDIINSRE
ncbi:MAG: hypothetical protein PHG96_12815 [Kiritimatiellae bacterium]|nr:hypothetical protein [Kiritimatiellia bacterium]